MKPLLPPRARRIAIWIGCILLGLVLGLIFANLAKPLSSLWHAVYRGGLKDDAGIESFLAQRRIAGCALAVIFAGWLGSFFLKRPLRLAATVTFFFAYTVLSTVWLPDFSLQQLLCDGRPARTVCGEGFSREGFLQIRAGMTKDQVATLVGRGLWDGRDPDNRARWFLTGGGTENHWRFGVEFDKDGTVDYKWLEFWWD